MKNTILLLFLLLCTSFAAIAQDDDLLKGLDVKDEPTLTLATFKGTRLVNFHTLEVPGRRTLDFRIAHRFGSFNSGWYDFFGLDGGASIRLGLEYSYDGRLEVGIGRTSLEKVADGFLKYRLLRQHDGGGMPLSVTLFSGAYYTMLKDPDAATNGFDKYENRWNRFSFCHQIIIGRKFTERLSIQVSPTYIHNNLAERISDSNDAFAIGFAGRFKYSKRGAITFEYGLRPVKYTETKYYDTMSIGWDVETGGHVFQMFVTNSLGLAETQFITRTGTKWADGGIRLGFNVSRAFTIGGEN